jgi:hypothetical protein
MMPLRVANIIYAENNIYLRYPGAETITTSGNLNRDEEAFCHIDRSDICRIWA